MSRLSETALCRYEPRLLSRSITILKPSSKTCCSMVSRTFDGDIPFCFSLFVVRLRDEAASVSTGGILIVEISRGQRLGQQAELSPLRYVEASEKDSTHQELQRLSQDGRRPTLVECAWIFLDKGTSMSEFPSGLFLISSCQLHARAHRRTRGCWHSCR